MHPLFTKALSTWEYIPFILVTLLFVAEAEVGNRMMGMTWNIVLTMSILVLMYVLLVFAKLPKIAVIIVACILWVGFIFVKRIIFAQSTTVLK